MLCWLFAATGWLGNFHSQMIAFPSVVIWNSFAESILGNWELRRLEKLLWRSWWLTKHILDEDERGSLAWRQGENPGSRRGGLDNLAMFRRNVFCSPDLFILWSNLVHSKVVLAHVYLISRTCSGCYRGISMICSCHVHPWVTYQVNLLQRPILFSELHLIFNHIWSSKRSILLRKSANPR